MNVFVSSLVIMLLLFSRCCVVDSGKVNVEFRSFFNYYGVHFTAISKSALLRMCHHLTTKRVCTKYKRSAWYNTTGGQGNDYYELDIMDNATKPNYDIKLHHKDLNATIIYMNNMYNNCERSKTWRGGKKLCMTDGARYETEKGRNGYVTIDILYSKPLQCKIKKTY